MKELSDSQLLRAYAELGSEPAFAELVRRHLDLIYSSAKRIVRESHLAKDVTQAVFLAVAKNATHLASRAVLGGWLHRTTRNIAAQTIRDDTRRRAREHEASAMNDSPSNELDGQWERIEPHLDEALDRLKESDRDALLLRYFARKSAREIGETLNISEEAAQKRITRALDRLREHLAGHGLAIGAGSLSAALSTNALQAAPSSLASTISSTVCIAGGSIASTAFKTALMTTTQKTLITATILGAITTGVYQTRKASHLHSENLALKLTQSALVSQIAGLEQERNSTSNRLASLRSDNEKLSRNTSELLKLRGEVGVLKRDLAASNSAGSKSDKTLPKSAWKLRESRKIAELQNVGNETPEAAAETVLWAAHNAPGQVLEMVHLPPGPLTKLPPGVTFPETEGVTVEEAARSSLAVWIGLQAQVVAQDGDQQLWIDGGEKTTMTMADPSQGWTNTYSGAVSFRLSGRRNMRDPLTEGHTDFNFANVDGVWKLIVPGVSPDISPQ